MFFTIRLALFAMLTYLCYDVLIKLLLHSSFLACIDVFILCLPMISVLFFSKVSFQLYQESSGCACIRCIFWRCTSRQVGCLSIFRCLFFHIFRQIPQRARAAHFLTFLQHFSRLTNWLFPLIVSQCRDCILLMLVILLIAFISYGYICIFNSSLPSWYSFFF